VKTATLLRHLDGWKGDARLYRLTPPLTEDRSWLAEPDATHEYVIVSGVTAFGGGEETFIFPALKDGHVKSWGEVEGSFQGSIDHAEALRGAGYEITEAAS